MWVDSVIFIRGHTLPPDKTIIVEEASENVTLVYSLDEKLFAFLSKPIKKYVFTAGKIK